ncbi:hypothetical protein ACN6K9_003757 [Streptomyces sp. SAS_267]|uniref:hypothetical protein n=1 Tax=unclassified Streptomyces TaxID=2593676 RepID=UPI0036FC901E
MTTPSGVLDVIGTTFAASSGGDGGRIDGVRREGPGDHGDAKDRRGLLLAVADGPEARHTRHGPDLSLDAGHERCPL